MTEMAAAEKIDRGYLGRPLQLTLLAPDIVEGMTLPGLLNLFPVAWAEQRASPITARHAIHLMDAAARP